MEKFALTLQSKKAVNEHAETSHMVKYERALVAEILAAIEKDDSALLAWFNSFGDSLRAILMNVYAYRKGLEFGFTGIAFDQYGWLQRPTFLDREDVKLGMSERYGEYSEIHLGRGVNGIWTYALNYSFGTAGGGSALSVYDTQFTTREAALTTALTRLKNMMIEKVGNTDTTNYKQEVIAKTLKAISAVEVNMVQLTLF